MAGRSNEEQVGVGTAIALIVGSVDRLEDSVVRMQQTIREDFATTGELEVVKLAVQQLRVDMDRRLSEIETLATASAAVAEKARLAMVRRDADARIVRWLWRVGIPGGALAILKIIWDAGLGAWLKSGRPPNP